MCNSHRGFICRTLPPAPVSLYDKDKSLCHRLLTCRHLCVIVCMYHFRYSLPSSPPAPLERHSVGFHSVSNKSFLDSFLFIYLFIYFFVFPGCSLLQRVQAEVRLLQEEIKETSKKAFIQKNPKTNSCVLGFLICLVGKQR